jgi:hypothetical protein
MGETEKGEGEQFAQAIVDIPRYYQPLLPERAAMICANTSSKVIASPS